MFDFLKPTKILEERESKFNGKIVVKRTWGLGTYIEVGGLTQSGGILSAIWNSTLRKIKNKKYEINNVLVLGLGGGTVVKSIRKYFPLARITGVDIDPVMVELGKKYLDLKDVKMKIADAFDCSLLLNSYSLVIVDLYQGIKYPRQFESAVFLKKLAKNKLVIINRLYSKDRKEDLEKFRQKLLTVFDAVETYRPEANVMFICLSSAPKPKRKKASLVIPPKTGIRQRIEKNKRPVKNDR